LAQTARVTFDRLRAKAESEKLAAVLAIPDLLVATKENGTTTAPHAGSRPDVQRGCPGDPAPQK
jgi:hypothetical protein